MSVLCGLCLQRKANTRPGVMSVMLLIDIITEFPTFRRPA